MAPYRPEKLGFGSSAPRSGLYIYHPLLDPAGLYTTRDPGCDPCLYSPKNLNQLCKSKKLTTKDVWTYKKELEDWSKNLGYRNQKILDRVKWDRSILGPAWVEIPPETKYRPACSNVGFGRTPRWKSTLKNNFPGPGTYFKTVPYKAPYGPHSERPTFEREEDCRFKNRDPNWLISPDRYNVIDMGSLDYKCNRVVSRRGPYDLFTGSRDQDVRNHFNAARCSAKTWPIALPGCFESLKKSHIGVFNKTNRDKPYMGRNALVDTSMCKRRPEDPGPGHYEMEKRVFVQNKYPFNSSYDRPRGYEKAVVWPGVGRYNTKYPSCGILGQGHKHVFLSKQKRSIGAVIPGPMNSF